MSDQLHDTLFSAGMHALTEDSLLERVCSLAAIDPDLGQIAASIGPPPLWARPPGFPTLVHIILEQQVSLASARAAYEKLLAAAGPLTPARLLEFSDAELKTIGFSRQKAAYCRGLAQAVLQGDLDLEALAQLSDAQVRAQLMACKGIGPWTADIYLLMVLRRPDIWPAGDLALASAVRQVKSLPERPTPGRLNEIAELWRPNRAVAARLLWHFYLSKPSR